MHLSLRSQTVESVCRYLGLAVDMSAPSELTLSLLIDAYTRHVPWESASRIARRAAVAKLDDCPRWPEQFWREALADGSGGTCFESNYAFYALLRKLGYAGYLTINNMGDSVGCHTAIVIELNDQRWLVDAGLPVYRPLRLDPLAVTTCASPPMRFSAHPAGKNIFQIEREPHPRRNAFTLIDRPVSLDEYERATINDYGDTGLFLDQIIINKVIDGHVWRYNGRETSPFLEHFTGETRHVTPITADLAGTLARRFNMAQQVLKDALAAVQ